MIYVDISAAVHSRAGLGRYAAHLAQALNTARPGGIALFHNLGRAGHVPTDLAGLPRRSVGWGYKPWRMAILAGQMARIPFNRLLPDAALFHATEHLLLPLRDTPTVLTVHDLIFKLFPDYHKKLNYYYLNWAMPLYCRRADALIAVSEATRRDVVAHYGISPTKIHVVSEAASSHFQPPDPARVALARQRYHLPERFLVHVGTLEPRKNLSRLLAALIELRRDWPDLHLVLAGARGWLMDDFFGRLEQSGLAGVVHALGWVPDEDLPAVIAAAALAVQPSLYEGFGLPVLEHMACGQVVAASQASSLPEVGGAAAAYFDPLDVTAMATVIRRPLLDGDEYAQRRQEGLAQAQRFSWARAAQETLAVYERLL